MNMKELATELMRIAEQVGSEGDTTPKLSRSDMIYTMIDFFVNNPNPTDDTVHKWAEGKGLDVKEVEAEAYKLATIAARFLKGGRANKKGVTEKDVDSDELAAGVKVEMEHTTDEDTAKRIALDHIAEVPPDAPLSYYEGLRLIEKIISNLAGLKPDAAQDLIDVLKEMAGETDSDKKKSGVVSGLDSGKKVDSARTGKQSEPLRSRRDYGTAREEEGEEVMREDMMSVADVRKICASCADKMERRGLKAVKASLVWDAVREACIKDAVASVRRMAQWETLPEGWTMKSLESYWNSLTGSTKHKITKCMKEMAGHVDDPGAFCGSLAKKMGYR